MNEAEAMIIFYCWDGRFTLGSLIYERQKDNLNTVQNELLGLSRHDYKPGGLANIHDRDRINIPEITGIEDVNLSRIPWSRNDRVDALA